MTAPNCGILPVAYGNEYRLDVLDFGISCSITPYVNATTYSQSVLFPEIKADAYELAFQDNITYRPTDKIRLGKIIVDIVLEEGAYSYEHFYNWMRVGRQEESKAFTTAVISLMKPSTEQPIVRFEYKDTLCVNISPINFDITNTDVARYSVTMQPTTLDIRR